ncbi:MAG: hypothetical protein MJ249_15010, partial [Kiritimatiellae bacterium]|nr:hypothetical protein [Kiritimatiellia bacterium]
VGGRTRVADDAEHGERSPGGLAAARELADVRNSPVSALGARRFLSLSISDMEELRKIVTGDVVPTAVAKNLPSGGIATRRGNVTLHSDVIGTVDRTDMDVEKATLKAHGFFRNEDPSWSMGQTDAAIRAEKQRSDAQLERQLIALGERRINRQEPGAQTAERGVFADQVAKIVMAEKRHVGGRLGRLQTIGKAVQDAVANMPGMNAADAEWAAKRFIDWAYGIPDYSQNMSGNELTAEMFGKWLVMPKEVEARAPEWANGIEGVIAGDRNLADAFRTLADRRLHGDEYLVEKIRKQMSRQTQETLNRLNNEKDEPISAGSTWKDLTEQFIYGMHDRFGPVYIRMDAETKTKIKAMKKALKAAPPAARPALKQQLDLYLGNLADKLNKLELARTAYERGNLNEGSVYHREMLRLENEATERWGLTTEDMSFYLDQWRVIETSGRSASFGEDVVQARRALGDMANRLGAQKWRRMQEFGNRWWAVHERELLDDPRAERMFGKAWIDYLRQNTHYVATERVHSQEEIDAIDSARRAARAAGVAGGDDIVSQCYDYAGAKGAGKDIGEGGWTARMTGSFAAKADVRGATLKKVDRLQRALRRNQLVLDLRDALEFAGVKGVRDLPRSEGAEFPSGSRYGHLNYIENGKKRTLVVPRQIADAFATGETANWYTKTTRMIHNTWRSLIIDWNPAYWPMNVRRNQDSIEKNVPGMRETYLKTALRATFPGLGTLSDLALQTVVRNIPATAKAFSDKTVFYYIPQAERICKIVESPSEWQQMYWDAQDRNDLAKIQQMNEDWRLAKEMLKANMFVSIGSVHRGENSQTFAADQFAKKGLRTIQEIDRALQSRSRGKRALDTLCWVAKKNQAQQEHEDVLAKAIAYLADRKHFGLVRTSAESGDLVNRRVSIAQGERKGAAAGTMKLIIPFYNMIEKGVVRHFNAYKTDFGHTLGADAKFVVGRVAGSLLANGVALTWMLNNCDGDEEKARKKFGIFFRYAKAYHDAYRNCSEYVRKNYQFTPFWTKGYTSIIIGGAMTDEEKLLSPIVDYTANSIAASEGIGEMPSFGSAILDSTVRAVVPDLQMTGPIIEGLRLAVVAATGENQTDYFRDAPMFDQRTLDNRFASAEDFKDFAAAVGARLWNYGGGRSVIAAGVNGVDNGRGEAPKPVEWALSDIPWISPLVNRMVKIQVGSPDKDTAAIKAQRKSIDSLLSVCAERMLERKRDGMAFHEHDWKGYEAQIQKYAQTYKLDEFDVAKLKEKYLNGFQQWKCRDAYDQRTVIKMKEEARRQGRTESAVWVMLGER